MVQQDRVPQGPPQPQAPGSQPLLSRDSTLLRNRESIERELGLVDIRTQALSEELVALRQQYRTPKLSFGASFQTLKDYMGLALKPGIPTQEDIQRFLQTPTGTADLDPKNVELDRRQAEIIAELDRLSTFTQELVGRLEIDQAIPHEVIVEQTPWVDIEAKLDGKVSPENLAYARELYDGYEARRQQGEFDVLRALGSQVNRATLGVGPWNQNWRQVYLSNTAQLPPGVTNQDIIEGIKALDLPSEHTQELQEKLTDPLGDLARRAEEYSVRRQLWLDGLDTADTDKLARVLADRRINTLGTDRWAMTLLQPFWWWQKEVAQVHAGAFTSLLRHSRELGISAGFTNPNDENWLVRFFGLDRETSKKFNVDYAQARAGGYSYWDAISHAYEEQDTHWTSKLIVEVISDPLSYLGFGVFPRLFKPVPGAFKALTMVDNAWNKAWELPFRPAANLYTKLPRTAAMIGRAHGVRAVTDVVKPAFEGMSRGVAYTKMNRTMFRNNIDTAYNHLLLNPDDYSPIGMAGRAITERPHITREEASELILQLDGNLDDLDVKAVGMNKLLNEAKTTPGGTLLPLDHAADELLLLVRPDHVGDWTPELVIKAKDIVRGYERKIHTQVNELKRAVSVQGKRGLTDRLIQQAIDARTADAVNPLSQYHDDLAVLWTGLAGRNRAIHHLMWGFQGLERLQHGVSRTFLISGLYTPWNVLETAVKLSLWGIAPWGKGEPVDMIARLSVGMPTPHFLLQEGAELTLDLGSNVNAVRELQATASGNAWRRTQQANRDIWSSDKWLGRKVGESIYDVTVRFGGRVTHGMQARGYIAFLKRAYVTHSATAPTVRRVSELVEAQRHLIRGVDRDTQDLIVEKAHWDLLTNARGFAERFTGDLTPDIIHSGKVLEIMAKYVDLGPEIQQYIADRASQGALWADLQSGALDRRIQEALWQQVFADPMFAREHIERMSRDVAQMVPKTEEEMRFHMVMQRNFHDMFKEMLTQQFRGVHAYTRSMRNRAQKEITWNEHWERTMVPLLRTATESFNKMAQHYKDVLVSVPMSEAKRLDYTNLLTAHTAYVEKIRLVRERVNDKAQELLPLLRELNQRGLRAGSPEVEEFWEQFMRERAEIWDEALGEVDELYEELSTATIRLDVENLVRPFIVQGQLTFQNVADLWGGSALDITNGLYLKQLFAWRSKRGFVSMVRSRANRVGRQEGRTASSMGFSDRAIGQLYDDHMRSVRADPEVQNLVGPRFDQWSNSALPELQQYMTTRHMVYPPEAQATIDEFKDRVLQSVREDGLASEVLDPRTLDPRVVDAQHQEQFNELSSYLAQQEVGNGVTFERITQLSHGLPQHLQRQAYTQAIQVGEDARNVLVGRVPNEGALTPELARAIREQDTRIEQVAKFLEAAEDLPDVDILPPNASWVAKRRKAHEEALAQYYLHFPRYDNEHMLSAAAKAIFPFWKYEAHRWHYLPRMAVQRPALYYTWASYNENTDGGYVRIPGTDLKTNLSRSTILGLTSRLVQRDYPEFYDQFPQFSRWVDQMARLGFFIGPIGTTAMSLPWSNKAGIWQTGEVLPPLAQTVLETFSLAFPEDSAVRTLREKIFPERFRDNLVSLEIDRRRATLEDGTPVYGRDLVSKKWAGEAFTPEEQQIWDSVQRQVAVYGIVFENVPLFTLRPREREEFRNLVREIMLRYLPYTSEQIDEAYRLGYNLELIRAFPPQLREAMRLLEGYDRWIGHSVGLDESLYAKQQALLNRYYERSERHGEGTVNDIRALDAKARAGTISIRDWERQRSKTRHDAHVIREDWRNHPPFEGLPIDFEQRVKVALERGMEPPVRHPSEELLAMYFDLDPEAFRFIDPDTGREVVDWKGFYQTQDMIAAAIPDTDKEWFETTISKNRTDLEQIHKTDHVQYINPYKALRNVVFQELSPEEQAVIKQYQAAGNDLQLREELRARVNAEGDSIVAAFDRRVREARQSMRYLNPDVDARLAFWGDTQTVLTEEAERILEELKRRYGFE